MTTTEASSTRCRTSSRFFEKATVLDVDTYDCGAKMYNAVISAIKMKSMVMEEGTLKKQKDKEKI